MKKKILLILLLLAAAVACLIAFCDLSVSWHAKGKTYDYAPKIPHRKVGLVLGTSPISTWNGRRNWYFDYRIRAAADLYHWEKVDWLIVSGGDYRQEGGYDEPVAMRDSLIRAGVDSARIILDYDGTRTLNSIAKVKDIYSADSIILISQKFHNERALMQARYLGVNAIALNARTPEHAPSTLRNRGREVLARVKLYIDMAMAKKPDIKETMQHKLVAADHDLMNFSDISTPHGDLLCLTPNMSSLSIDMLCDSIPDAENGDIAIAFAGAFTGKMWNAGHSNIASDHVACGIRHKGYPCRRNTGAFTWSAASGHAFHYNDFSQALDKAAEEGGMAFAQEMMIHHGKQVPTTRPLNNTNQFRALCQNADGSLAIYESRGIVGFGNFIMALLDAGVTEALYTDMGPGWNYCFYRNKQGQPANFLHNVPQSKASNFIIFKTTN